MVIYDFSVITAQGTERSLSDFKGKVLLVVNTASKCGFTPQYAELQTLYDSYHEKGLEILAFPCDQFAHQEPGTDAEIQSFCQINYGVTFPIFAKIEVNGKNANPLFKYLRSLKKGMLSDAIKWNFTKFLVDRHGNFVERYAPSFRPSDIAPELEKLLAES
ncbi:MAG: glutathione peroxidase [Anaerolineaceae bacterium]